MRIITLKFTDRVARFLIEICKLRDASSIESLFMKLTYAELAGLRLTKLANRTMSKGRPGPPPENIGTLEKKCRLRGEQAQIILALHQEDVPVRAIAKRLSCSVMKVHRVIHNYQRSTTRVPESTNVIIRKGPRAKSRLFNPSERT